MARASFPKDFLWGASTSSHQVEGNTTNQWSEWEKAHARQLAKDAERQIARLDNFGWKINWKAVSAQATVPGNYLSGDGVDHYHRYAQDFSLVQSLHMNAFRFSIEWSRLAPTEGAWDTTEIAHYHHYIDEMKARGIEPVLTLWHWTLPIWFAEKGGFAQRRNIHYFDDYVRKIGEEFGDKVHYMLTLNEPNVYALTSYIAGLWPPEQKNPITAVHVYRNLATAHKHS
jgi:beta-glucosidase